MKEEKDTSWFHDAIIYHIFVDRFAGCNPFCTWDKPDFCGGNIKGIISKMSYFEDLGINTLLLSPFVKGGAYHGYFTQDYLAIDPRFGTIDDVKELIKKAHDRGIKIIYDFVPNHCSSLHPFFLEAQTDEKSDYVKWFYFTNWPNSYEAYYHLPELPKLNLDYEPAREYITDVAKYWLSLGIDGLRLDHAVGPSHDFWKYFNKRIKKEFPGAVLIGEVWLDNIIFSELKTSGMKDKFLKWIFSEFGRVPDTVFKEYIETFDGLLDFRVQSLFARHIAHAYMYDKKALENELRIHYSFFPKNFFLPTFLDNHDMNRFLFECDGNKEKLKEAIRMQFAQDQPVVIYNGSERGMSQLRSLHGQEHGDLFVRQPIDWKHMDADIYGFYKTSIKLRKDRKKKEDK